VFASRAQAIDVRGARACRFANIRRAVARKARPIAPTRRHRSRATTGLERWASRDRDGTRIANDARARKRTKEKIMGTAQNGNVNQQQGGQQNLQGQNPQGQGQGNVGSPISNEAYNVISALASKLEGLEAYRKYCKDGDAKIWQQLTQIEVEGVQKLVDELENLVKNNKLRMGTPGKANG
jgi:hypothetical protein